MSGQSSIKKQEDPRSSQYALGLPAAFYTTDARGRITLYNQAAVDLWGREPVIGKDLWCGSWRIFRTDGSPMPLDECPMAEALREARPVYGKEIIIERPDGERRHVLPHPKPILNSSGDVVEAINMLVDITDQKRADKALRESEDHTRNLKEANNKLERANHELEQFAFVASHDMQEPLRKIQIFADSLYQNYEKALTEDGLNKLDKIRQSAKRMSVQINDLLNFSRLSAEADSFEKTDLNTVLQSVENDFELLLTQKGAVIKSERLPVINAVPLQMNQLFFNILGNSLKFSSSLEAPLITITSQFIPKLEDDKFPALDHSRSYYEVAVSDNGIGFDQKFADQIFVIFQRLVSRSQYDGSGIGLALCKKIAASHGGDIYAMSEENKGACFRILLPAPQEVD